MGYNVAVSRRGPRRKYQQKGAPMSDFLTLAANRYSCRKFSDQPVSEEQVTAILTAGILAPAAVDKQPWHAWVITGEDDVARLAATTRFHFDAKTFIVVGSAANEAWVRKFDGYNYADVDATIAATQMMLEVQDLGLGTTWVGHFDAPALKEAFPQMAGYNLLAIFPLGYPAADAEPGPLHAKRKPADELIDHV